MDLSSFGDTRKFRNMLTSQCPAVIGTVPIYDAVVYYHKALKEITTDEWLDIVKMHAQDGVDFMTIHCGINKSTAERFKKNKRLTNIVSRGGSIIFAWMEMTGKENPFYERFDEILEICQEYDVTLSLGDACRPGSIADASDISQIERARHPGRTDKAGLGKECPGYDRRPRPHASGSDRGQYADPEDPLQGRALLCAGPSGDRCGSRL